MQHGFSLRQCILSGRRLVTGDRRWIRTSKPGIVGLVSPRVRPLICGLEVHEQLVEMSVHLLCDDTDPRKSDKYITSLIRVHILRHPTNRHFKYPPSSRLVGEGLEVESLLLVELLCFEFIFIQGIYPRFYSHMPLQLTSTRVDILTTDTSCQASGYGKYLVGRERRRES